MTTQNLEPVTLTEIQLQNGKKLVCREPLVLTIKQDNRLLIAENYELGLCAFAPTREELLGEITGEFQAIWKLYALEDPEMLTENAVQLKHRLLAFFTEE